MWETALSGSLRERASPCCASVGAWHGSATVMDSSVGGPGVEAAVASSMGTEGGRGGRVRDGAELVLKPVRGQSLR